MDDTSGICNAGRCYDENVKHSLIKIYRDEAQYGNFKMLSVVMMKG